MTRAEGFCETLAHTSVPNTHSHKHARDHSKNHGRTCLDDSRTNIALRPPALNASPPTRTAATRTSHRSSLAPTAATARASRSTSPSPVCPSPSGTRCSGGGRSSGRPSRRQSSDKARQCAFVVVVREPTPTPPPTPPTPLGASAQRAISKSTTTSCRTAKPSFLAWLESPSMPSCGGAS